ncbi:MAG: hypothetical protein JXM73_14225 [Anaerolineae bacterium]|nr:hypothetical protein [Anaerolineae bacterium]
MYAVNLVGLMGLGRELGALPLYLLLRGIVTEQVVQAGSGMGHEALVVRDDVPAERWRAIVAVVRSRYWRVELPLYERVSGRWRYA